ncbi:TRAP transporter large permease subunit [Arthrobacter sp. 92]|uniref:TRAP transporter large permease n=1 Tax=Arthrobacter sp. 92 TaxID=3418175 RepID=UPI003CFF7206
MRLPTERLNVAVAALPEPPLSSPGGMLGPVLPVAKGRLARGLELAIAIAASLTLVASLVVVFISVISRYFFNNPLAWAGEISGTMLVTIGFFGGALALARGEHLGVAALRSRLHGWMGEVNEGLIAWIVVIVAVALCWSSQAIIDAVAGQTMASGVPEAFNYYPVLISGGVMAVFAIVDLVRLKARALLASAGILTAVAAIWGLWEYLLPDLAPLPIVLLLVGFAIALIIGVPIAFALCLGALLYFWTGGSAPIALFAQQMESGISNVVLLAIPFFVLAGLVMEINGMSKRLIDLLLLGAGRSRGGLRIVMIAAMALFSGISGSKSADVAAVGTTLLPAIRKAGQDDKDAVALLAATAIMGETIPPCINMIILGYVANLSIGGLFVAGIVPAAVIGLALLVVAVTTAPRAGQTVTGSSDGTAAIVPRRSRSQILKLVGGASTALVMIVIIFGGILGGIATPTEVAAFAVVYAFVVGGLIFREMKVGMTASFLVRSASLSGMILFIVAAAQAVTYVLTAEQVPQTMAQSLVGLAQAHGTWLFLLVCTAMLIVMGSVLEGAPALIIFGPLLLPIAVQLGVNELQFGILLILAMGLGLFSPPLGVGLYTACAIGGVPMEKVARPMVKYLAAIVIVLIGIIFFPWLTQALPHALGLG